MNVVLNERRLLDLVTKKFGGFLRLESAHSNVGDLESRLLNHLYYLPRVNVRVGLDQHECLL